MLTYQSAFYELKDYLRNLYDERECVAISHDILEYITSKNKIQRLIEKENGLTESELLLFDNCKIQLSLGTPLQYIIGKAWFYSYYFTVNSDVLIPRPETEELVQWIIDDYKGNKQNTTILDVGTGTACISCSLQLKLPNAQVLSCDISEQALFVAKENTKNLGATVQLFQMDFLDKNEWGKLGNFDILVSNPPYIPLNKKADLHINVKDFEPEIALFVPTENSLLFYIALAQFGKSHLNTNASIYCELESENAGACKILFEEWGYVDVELKKDMHGNLRMLKANTN